MNDIFFHFLLIQFPYTSFLGVHKSRATPFCVLCGKWEIVGDIY